MFRRLSYAIDQYKILSMPIEVYIFKKKKGLKIWKDKLNQNRQIVTSNGKEWRGKEKLE